MQKPIQFGLVQLLWGTALIAVCFPLMQVVMNPDPPRLADPAWGLLVVAAPPIAGGFIGLFRNNTKGMLAGIARGLLVSLAVMVLLFLLFLPRVQ